MYHIKKKLFLSYFVQNTIRAPPSKGCVIAYSRGHLTVYSIRNSWERNIQGFPHVFIPKLQFTTSCISAHIHITVFQLVSLQSVCSPLLNTITTYLVSFTFICQRAECTTCLPVKSTILSTASQPSYGYKYDDRQVTAYTTL